MSTLHFTAENGVATIVLNRPEAFNSLNKELAHALQDALDK